MTHSISGDSDVGMVLLARQVKKVCKARDVKLSLNAFTCLNELCRDLFNELLDGMKFDDKNKEQAFNASSDPPYEQLKQIWMKILGLDYADEELLPILSRSYRVMELHWACMEKHVRNQGPVCCEEIQECVGKMRVSGLMEMVTGNRNDMINWIPLMTSIAMLDGIMDWIITAANLASHHLDDMKIVHRDELVILLQSANCLKNCKVVSKLSRPMSLLGERPSMETFTSTLLSIEEKELLEERKFGKRSEVRYVACIDPKMPWIKIQEGEVACIAKTIGVETSSIRENVQDDDILSMKQEMNQLRQLVQQLALSKSAM